MIQVYGSDRLDREEDSPDPIGGGRPQSDLLAPDSFADTEGPDPMKDILPSTP